MSIPSANPISQKEVQKSLIQNLHSISIRANNRCCRELEKYLQQVPTELRKSSFSTKKDRHIKEVRLFLKNNEDNFKQLISTSLADLVIGFDGGGQGVVSSQAVVHNPNVVDRRMMVSNGGVTSRAPIHFPPSYQASPQVDFLSILQYQESIRNVSSLVQMPIPSYSNYINRPTIPYEHSGLGLMDSVSQALPLGSQFVRATPPVAPTIRANQEVIDLEDPLLIGNYFLLDENLFCHLVIFNTQCFSLSPT